MARNFGTPPRSANGRVIVGVVMAAAGLVGLNALLFGRLLDPIGYDRLMLQLGLGLTAVLSAAAQFAVVFGVWLVWRAMRRR